MIELSHLSKRFGRPRPTEALNDVSFKVKEGSILGLLGHDGAGKTTLLRILATLMKPTAGSATVAGFDISEQPGKVKDLIGYLPQVPALDRNTTVSQYLNFWGRVDGLSGRERRERLKYLLHTFNLENSASHMVYDISTYERATMFLAQTLLTQPRVLLLDEPMLGLTLSQSERFGQVLRGQQKEGLTMVVASSVMQEVLPVCTHFVVLSEGRATQTYQTSALLKSLGEGRHARIFVEAPSIPTTTVKALRDLNGVVDVLQAPTATVLYVEPGALKREEVERTLKGAGLKVYRVKVGEITLGDVFRTLYKEA